MLGAAASVVTTSEWTRRVLMEMYSLPGERVHVARPGVDAADLAPGTADAGALLCVAAVTPGKGHDVLLDALATIGGLSWHCRCVGSLDRDPAFAEALRRRVRGGGLGDRVCFAGPLTGAELDQSYGAADLLVLASRAETYGMVVTEALARGLPVIAAEVGGVPEALGRDRGRGRARAAGAARRRGCAWRSAASLAGQRRAAAAAAPGRTRAARGAAGMDDHHVGRRGRAGGGGAMSVTAIRLSPELARSPRGRRCRAPAPATSSTSSGGDSRQPARW